MRIGILGGTFDPIHRGHLRVARSVLGAFRLDRIYFMVSHFPPHKTKRDLTGAFHRFAMVAIDLSDERNLYASQWELERDRPSYTIETLEHFTKHCANDQFWPRPLLSPLVDRGDPDISDPDETRSDIGAFGGPTADPFYFTDQDGDCVLTEEINTTQASKYGQQPFGGHTPSLRRWLFFRSRHFLICFLSQPIPIRSRSRLK